MTPDADAKLQYLIDLQIQGNPSAHDALLDHSCERLLRLTRKMLRSYPSLRRWEQTDDVFQNSMVRLHRALASVQVESVRHFFNLAALQIRRELLDLSRHYFGPEGLAANHHTDSQPSDDRGGKLHESTQEPDDIGSWAEFHKQIEQLPQDEQEVANLLYYEGLSQDDAARVLGVSVRTIKRRWQSAKLKLYKGMQRESEG
ncbi:MAG: RNA polymerase sigma factor [Pirellula sp.]